MSEVIFTALEVGLIYSLVALALYISYSILNIADLSTDGCYTLGCAVGITVTLAGHPVLAIFLAMLSGVASGFVTAFLQTRLKIESILAGIIVNTGLYTVNLAIMGFSSNLSVFGTDTVFSLAKNLLGENVRFKLVVIFIIAAVAAGAVIWFLGTRLGLSVRATGDNPDMVRASSINPAFTTTVGLCISGSLTALAGCLIGQYNKFADINLGVGMVTIALASLLIGRAIFGKRSVPVSVIGVIVGSCIYRGIISLALTVNISTEYFKLVSAVIVAVSIAVPKLKPGIALAKAKRAAKAARGNGGDDNA